MTQYADYTYLSTALRCMRQHYYKYRLHLTSSDGHSSPLLAGRMMHKVLEAYYRGEPWEPVLAEEYARQRLAVGKHDYMTQGHFEVIMQNYIDAYPNDSDLIVANYIEEPLVSDRLMIGGIPDLIIDKDGVLQVWDHKFTTSWMGNLEKRQELSPQMPVYCILASEKYGERINSAVLNGIHMGPGASNPKSKAERFLRRPFTYSEHQLQETERWIAEAREVSELDIHPKNPESHCSWCDFKPLCTARSAPAHDATVAAHYLKRSVTGTLLSGADMEEN